MRWFRFYAEVLDDPKVQRLPAELFKCWVNLLCLANRAEARGTLPPIEDVAFGLRLPEERCRAILDELRNRGLLDESEEGLTPHNWSNRQAYSDTPEAAAERKRRQRDREKLGHCDSHENVTPQSRVDKKQITTSHAADAADTDSDAFHEAWGLYPKRAGGNPKGPARKAWSARMRERVDPAEITAGVRRYAAFIRATGKEGTEYVMQAATMFGPGERWREEYQPPTGNTRPGPQMSGNYGLPPLIVDD